MTKKDEIDFTSDSLNIKFAINEVLEERGKSAYWLAQQIGMDESQLSKLRRQSTGIRWKALLPICKALECTPGDLIVLVNEKPDGKKQSKSKA